MSGDLKGYGGERGGIDRTQPHNGLESLYSIQKHTLWVLATDHKP